MASTDDRVINGNTISAQIRTELKAEVDKLKADGLAVPGLVVILVGDRTDSATYVRMKEKACQEIGFNSTILRYPANIAQDEIVAKLKELNEDANVHGILVQVPLPEHMNEYEVLDVISREKDVDGFHPLNIGKLALKGHEPDFVPCTPKGCMELLKRSGVDVAGKKAVVLGRSNIVGIPISLLLLNANATVTVCHSRTKNVEEICRDADILVAAIGQPEYVKKDWVKEGAVIIDVGINSVPDATKKTGYRLVGDVSKDAYDRASKYTPVPGGVGPMTVAMLMQNTLQSARKWYAKQSK
jgi:5,10-methylene-tetrahydrofolate dehydrogenase/methenyl tetrahydrofolate cyclohydrolase